MMEGIDVRELVKKRGTWYMCLVEAVLDHEIIRGNPNTDIVRKGALGVAYDFWYWGGNRNMAMVAVEWKRGHGRNYIETYKNESEVNKPITEIKFVRDLAPGEGIPEENPLYEERHSQ